MKPIIEIPLLPLRDIVVYPHIAIPLYIGRDKSIEALETSMNTDKKIILLTQKKPSEETPTRDTLYSTGTLANITHSLKLPDGTVKILVEGVQRLIIEEIYLQDGKYLKGKAQLEDAPAALSLHEDETFRRTLLSQLEQYTQLGRKISPEIFSSFKGITDTSELLDTIASHIATKIEQKQIILEKINIKDRLEYILTLLSAEIELLQVEKKIRNRIKTQMGKSQREYYLNEQIKAIQKELGELDESYSETEELKKRIEMASLSQEAIDKAEIELKKLKQMSPMSAEATVIRSYIDWLIQIPWKKKTRLSLNLENTEKVLNKDHYGLDEVKNRILEYLAVQKRVRKNCGSVLCLVGPPGVGKTSLAKSIARATGRKFIRIALGGVRDEAEIRGHRRTYIGSMPGRIIQRMAKSAVCNPLFLLDEIDKMGSDTRSDPSSALLEVLDPEQNHAFNDHYLEIDYDLSNVMFICTANSMNIHPALLDRMEIIRIPGYTDDEKISIASRYLLPYQLIANGLKRNELLIDRKAISLIARHYTREAGVRDLERNIAKICRKVVRRHSDKKGLSVSLEESNIETFLGVQKFHHSHAKKKDRIGQVTGLAWTQAGGELLTIEASVVTGKGQLIKTGSLGDVMSESITAALTFIRSCASNFGLELDFYEKKDIHIHVPEGATPKDGPSAGIAMCLAIISALTSIPVRSNIAMTGEITLRGSVLPIGGLKEKLLAAKLGNIEIVLIPEANVRDLKEIPDSIKKGLEIKSVQLVSEVLQIGLKSCPKPPSTNKTI